MSELGSQLIRVATREADSRPSTGDGSFLFKELLEQMGTEEERDVRSEKNTNGF